MKVPMVSLPFGAASLLGFVLTWTGQLAAQQNDAEAAQEQAAPADSEATVPEDRPADGEDEQEGGGAQPERAAAEPPSDDGRGVQDGEGTAQPEDVASRGADKKEPSDSASASGKAEGSEKAPDDADEKVELKPKPKPKIDYSKVPWTFHQKRLDLGAGLLASWATDPAFDLFREQDFFASFSARGALSFWASGPISVAAGVNYDTAALRGQARGQQTWLNVHRIQAGGQVRFHFLPSVYGYGRLNVGAYVARSALGDADSDSRMELDGAGVSGALSLGGAVRIAGSPDGRVRSPRLHLFAEGGLGYDSPLTLEYEMSSSGVLRPEPVDLGKLSLGGPRITLGALVSY